VPVSIDHKLQGYRMDPNMKLLIVIEVTRKFKCYGTLWRKNTLFFYHPKIYLDAAPCAFAYLHPGIKRTSDVVFWIITAYILIGITIRETSCVFTTMITAYLITITIQKTAIWNHTAMKSSHGSGKRAFLVPKTGVLYFARRLKDISSCRFSKDFWSH
jgi:hypothetical protein